MTATNATPWRHDGATTACPACGRRFAPCGRRRYCSDACRSAAFRRRQQGAPAAAMLPAGVPRRALTVYQCPDCDARFAGGQRCPDCGVFARRAGLGGCCPHCDEPVTVAELVGDGVVADHTQGRRR